ncbi:hypothetical protein BCR43DRAFT_457109 [Syncephalastrum racemosum]|uniref:Protein BIG1 n=1 Tax=Syncephalastrum racemosum TaxID=13706 RepID=A0A1X2HG48_SYNRA|nr:hypothetical protein BCR43DRAFT_457109 [Syncephalastrum racemosum]
MKLYTVALLSSLASAALAFEGSVPCLAWSPKQNYLSAKSAEQFIFDNALEAISDLTGPDICAARVVAVVDQPGIHRNDFVHSSDAFATLRQHHRDAIMRRDLEYVAGGVDIEQLTTHIASECDSTITVVDPDTVSSQDIHVGDGLLVAQMALPAAHSVETMKENDVKLDALLKAIKSSAGDDYIVIYTSSVAKTSELAKRGNTPFHRRAPQDEGNSTSAPIFEKYQLFTPGIFMAITVSLIVVFITAVGVTWLVGIQTPVRFEGKPKRS